MLDNIGIHRYNKDNNKQPNVKERGTDMKQFEIGNTYTMRSICNHECVWVYKVTKRTASTITITDGKEVKTCRINKQVSDWNGTETIYPLGRYSMCPSLRA